MARMKRKYEEVDVASVRDLVAQVQSNWAGLPDWIQIGYNKGNLLFANDHIVVTEVNGNTSASMQDFIVRDADGNLFTRTPNQIASKYEAV